ncbi:hypothetical protein [Methylobacterium sp. WSM2598]|uniref:hypothetical protein n=1 Tax=Methylobacterium sp. WSM2598 TaxID=398261 RepID=UPI0009FC3B55|nr:hypothetical protein [Methylobacterium sp. WSM2598]
MKTLIAASSALMLRSAAPSRAMSCCGSGKGKGATMCGKDGMTGMKGKEGSRCCEGMSSTMSHRS